MTSLRHAGDQYIDWRYRVVSTETVAGERPTLEYLVQFVDTRVPGYPVVSDLTPGILATWYASLSDLAASTRETRLAQVRSFLRYCREREWLTGDPTALLRAPKVRPTDRERYNAGELLALLEAAKHLRDRAVIAVGINLALRGGEIARLRIADLDLDGGTLHVSVDKTNEVDDMPITSDLDVELRRWVTHYMAVCPQVDKQAYLFPAMHVNGLHNTVTYKPEKPIAEPYLIVKRALEARGLPSHKEGVHTLRRSVAALYFDLIEGEETFDSALLATMTLLHHTQPATTLRYIGRDRQKLARDRLLRGKPFLTTLVSPRANVVPLPRSRAVAN